MDCELRLYVDRVPPGRQADARQAAAVRAMYVVDGAIRLRAGGCAASLTSNSAWVGTSEVEIGGGHAAATVLRWELVGRGAPPAIAAGGIESRLSLGAVVSLDPAVDHLLRCDRVDFPPGGEALPHTHQGPGIRCLLFGAIRIETQGTVRSYEPLQSWFEAGPHTVYAAASPAAATAFARVMILPAAIRGQSSIRYVRAEDGSRPKSQSYQVFADEPIGLPGA